MSRHMRIVDNEISKVLYVNGGKRLYRDSDTTF